MIETVYVSIGNSDDKLTQEKWAAFYGDTSMVVSHFSLQTHGQWTSIPFSRWQNACWCFDVDTENLIGLRPALAKLAHRYQQDWIALAIANTEIIKPAE